MSPPEFWIVAGPNGAGKTTCVQKEPISRLLPDVQFLNPDDLTLAKLEPPVIKGSLTHPLTFRRDFSWHPQTKCPPGRCGNRERRGDWSRNSPELCQVPGSSGDNSFGGRVCRPDLCRIVLSVDCP